MKIISILLILLSIQIKAQDVPFLNHDNFEFKMDYDFETKPPPVKNKINMTTGTEEKYSADLLPYVKLNFSFTDLSAEAFRARVLSGDGGIIKSRKLKKIEVLNFDLGFADDIKDRISPHTYYIFIENKDKSKLSKIKIFIEESGDFYLNDKLYGKI